MVSTTQIPAPSYRRLLSMMRSLGISILLLFGLLCRLQAQDVPMENTTVWTCNGNFTDAGGFSGNYPPNDKKTMTLCPDGTEGTHIRLTFPGIVLGKGDLICFYDGPNTFSPQFFCGYEDKIKNPFIVQATAKNSTGCITVTFSSDSTDQTAGWSAAINCVRSCQTIDAMIPGSIPALDTATQSIDVCVGEDVEFNGAANFPQNNLKYFQSEALSTFTWDFGNGHGGSGKNSKYRFSEPGGYTVRLLVMDTAGCTNTNFASVRVRVSGGPKFDFKPIPDPVCMGDTLVVTTSKGLEPRQQIHAEDAGSEFRIPGMRSDSLALPDGDGASYQTSISFLSFGPNQVVQAPDDIESVCINMEHTFLRDLEIELICPSGKSATLVNHIHDGQQVFLGVPNVNDENLPEPIPGQGYTYCWSQNATNINWLDYINAFSPPTLPEGSYKPFQGFENLVGCPLNGDWTIKVTDLWKYDNGFVFWWGINFKKDLYPAQETFQPEVKSLAWIGNATLLKATQQQARIASTLAGFSQFRLIATDDFGCTADTSIRVNFLPFADPACFSCPQVNMNLPDTTVCSKDTLELIAPYWTEEREAVTFRGISNDLFGHLSNPPGNPYASTLRISAMNPGKLLDVKRQLHAVCLNIACDRNEDLDIWLRTPGGKMLELSTANGGLSKDYDQTCFTPNAAQSITAASGPFSGSFLPEGNLNDLLGEDVNGDWTLLMTDSKGFNKSNRLLEWSMTWDLDHAVKRQWVSTGNLSCDTCAVMRIEQPEDAVYIADISDIHGCHYRDTAQISVETSYELPFVWEAENINQHILFRWDPVAGASAYEVRVNGGAWQAPNGILQHQVDFLMHGDTVVFEVRVKSDNKICLPPVAQLATQYLSCSFYGEITALFDVSCYGANNGRVFLAGYNGSPPISYALDGGSFGTVGFFLDLAAGPHIAYIKDAIGCIDTLPFVIQQPSDIQAVLSIDSVSCFNKQDGSAVIFSSGGTGEITYYWPQINVDTNFVTGLKAGIYYVVSKDSNNCLRQDTVAIYQPAQLTAAGIIDSVSCYGLGDGKIEVKPNGGTPAYLYMWEDGSKQAIRTGLQAGSYLLTLTDKNTCQASVQFDLYQPAALNLNTSSTPVSCQGVADGSAQVVVSGGTLPISYLWNDPKQQSGSQATGLAAGSYTVTVTDANGCTATANFSFSDPAPLAASVTAVNATCPGVKNGSAALSGLTGGNTFSFQWNDPLQQKTAQAIGLATGAYSVTITNENGCTLVKDVTVGADAPIEVNILVTPPTCSGDADGSALVQVLNGTGPFGFLWNDPKKQVDSLASNLLAGTYQVTVSGAGGCQLVEIVKVQDPDPLSIDQFLPVQPTCYGTFDGSLQAVISGGTPTYFYAWGDPFAQTAPQASGLGEGLYYLTVTDSKGCSVVSSYYLEQPDALSLPAIIKSVSCYGGQDGAINLEPEGGTPPYSFQWFPTGLPPAEDQSQLQGGNYMVTLSDSRGCTEIRAFTVNTPLLPLSSDIKLINLPCAGGNQGTAVASGVGGTGQLYQFAWSNGQNAAQANGLSKGTYTVTVTDEAGCSVRDSVSLSEYAPISANIIRNNPTCFGYADGGAGINLVSGGVGGNDPANYQIAWGSQPVQTGLSATGLRGGSYQVTISDAQGCRAVQQFELKQPARISFQAEVQPVTCPGGKDGVARVLQVKGDVPFFYYSWDAKAFAQITPAATDLKGGTYSVTITDSTNCSVDTTLTVPEPPAFLLNFDVQGNKCQGEGKASVMANVSGANGGYQYLWSNGSNSNKLADLDKGLFTLTVTDAKGCTVSDSVRIQEPTAINFSFEASQATCWNSNDGKLVVKSSGGAGNYVYSLDGKTYQVSNDFHFLKKGSYTVWIRDENGCVVMGQAEIQGPDPFQVRILADTNFLTLGDSTRLQVQVIPAGNPAFINWELPASGTISCLDCAEVVVRPLSTQVYRVQVEDVNGCAVDSALTIFVSKDIPLHVPTGFTPNQDGNNDLLQVHGRPGLYVESFRIYDRWGELVSEITGFAVNDASRGWDGTYQGKPLNPAVFIWVADVRLPDGSLRQYKGQSTLLR